MKVTYKVKIKESTELVLNYKEFSSELVLNYKEFCDFVTANAKSPRLQSELVVYINARPIEVGSVENYCAQSSDLQKLLLQARGQCRFERDWCGFCAQPAVGLYCESHTGAQCVVCKRQASHSCEHTMTAFVCGAYLCDQCEGYTVGDAHGHSTCNL